MKWLTPGWMKWTNILRWGVIGGFTVFAVFFYDFSTDPMNPSGENPFQPVSIALRCTPSESIAYKFLAS